MKAISIRQPWCDLIASNRKTIEIRTWVTKHRGDVMLCASQPDGHARCIVDLVDCRPMMPGDSIAACCPYEPGVFAWILRNVRMIKPFPVKGRLGFYDVIVPESFQLPVDPLPVPQTQIQPLAE